MKIRLIRWFPCGVPAGALIACLCGAGCGAASLATSLLLINCLSLAAPEALRRAQTRLLSRRKVYFSTLTAVFTVFLGFFAAYLLLHFLHGRPPCFFSSEGPVFLRRIGLFLLSAALLLAVRCVSELLHALGNPTGAYMLEFLSGLAVAAGLLLDAPTTGTARFPLEESLFSTYICSPSTDTILSEAFLQTVDPGFFSMNAVIPPTPFFLPVFCGAVLLISVFAVLAEKPQLPAPTFSIFRDVPAALLRTTLHPALFSAVSLLSKPGSPVFSPSSDSKIPVFAAFFLGNMILEYFRTAHRCDDRESRPMIAASAWTGAAACLVLRLSDMCLSHTDTLLRCGVLLPMLCGLLLYGCFSVRMLVPALTMTLAVAAPLFPLNPITLDRLYAAAFLILLYCAVRISAARIRSGGRRFFSSDHMKTPSARPFSSSRENRIHAVGRSLKTRL